MPMQSLKTKQPQTVALAPSDIAAEEAAHEFRAAQYRWEAKQRDLDAKYASDGNRLRDEYLSEVQALAANGAEE